MMRNNENKCHFWERKTNHNYLKKMCNTSFFLLSIKGMVTKHLDSLWLVTNSLCLRGCSHWFSMLSISSGNPMSAVYAIPANRSDYSGYVVSTPPSSYRSPSWMSYPPEPEDVPPQWADSVSQPSAFLKTFSCSINGTSPRLYRLCPLLSSVLQPDALIFLLVPFRNLLETLFSAKCINDTVSMQTCQGT